MMMRMKKQHSSDNKQIVYGVVRLSAKDRTDE
jgi:hypothetical protein